MSNESARLLDDRKEIAAVLRAAKVHLWQFSFFLPGKPADSPFTTELLRVDPDAGVLVFGPEVNTLASKGPKVIRFHARSGGLKISFDSETIPETEKQNSQFYSSYCKMVFPGKLVLDQMRKAVRVNFSNLANIPVTLFANEGHDTTGTVEDISETGVKAKFPGYLVEKFAAGELIADCGLVLPDKSQVTGKVQVLGTLYDFQEDVSYVRCCFKGLDEKGEIRLKRLIAKALEKTELAKTA